MKCSVCEYRGILGQQIKGFSSHVMCKIDGDFKVANKERGCEYEAQAKKKERA